MLKKISLGIFITLATLLTLIWITSPLLVRSLGNKVLSDYDLSLGNDTSVRINPFTFVIEINNLELLDNTKSLLQLEHLSIDVDPTRFVTGKVSVSFVNIRGFAAEVEQTAEGILIGGVDLAARFASKDEQNVSDTNKVNANAADESQTVQAVDPTDLQITVRDIRLEQFDLQFANAEVKANLGLRSLNIDSFNFAPGLIQLDVDADLRLEAALNQTTSTTSLAVDTLAKTNVTMRNETTSEIIVDNTSVELSNLVANAANYDVRNELIKVDAETFQMSADENLPTIDGVASFVLQGLKVKPTNEKGDNQTLTLSSVELPSIRIIQNETTTEPQVQIATINLQKLHAMVVAEESKKNLLELSSLIVNELEASASGASIDKITLGKVDVNTLLTESKQLQPMFVASSDSEINQSEQQAETEPPAKGPDQTADNSATSPFRIAVGEFSLKEPIDVYFKDNSVEPAFASHFYLNQLTLVDMDGTQPQQQALLTVRGGIDEYTKLSVDAKLLPFLAEPKYVIDGNLTELSLPELSPYVDQALGYVIETGQLDNKFDAEITGGIISGESVANLKAIDLTAIKKDGEKKGINGGAISLNMALNMLKDGDGNVELAVPISGDLNNPSVGVSGIVSLIVKQATMSAAKDYLITTFLPYSKVVKIALSASDSLLKMSFEPLYMTTNSDQFNKDESDYLNQLGGALKENKDIKVKICPVSASAQKLGTDKSGALDLAKRQGQRVKQYLVTQLKINSERLYACAAEIDPKGQTRIKFEQL